MSKQNKSWWAFTQEAKIQAVFYQILILVLMCGLGFYLISNTLHNLEIRQIKTGFDFLEQEAGFDISESIISYGAERNYARALFVGFLNTLHVSILALILTTILGVIVGVASLSRNWLLARMAMGYVGILRNIPVLLQIILWHTLLTNLLPHPRQAFSFFDQFFLSNRGFYLPSPELNEVSFIWGIWTFMVVAVAAIIMWQRRRETAISASPAVLWGSMMGAALVSAVFIWLLGGAPFNFEIPAFKGFNFSGGLRITPEFSAVLFGLTVYTSAYIAENVRAGILAIPRGQSEAGRSLGLSEGVIMRKIILPQALRVIIPPTTNQYLNLVKNSSLSVAVGYPDLVSTAQTALNQTGQAVEAITIMMIVYLTTSLLTSLFMNWYNAHIQLVER